MSPFVTPYKCLKVDYNVQLKVTLSVCFITLAILSKITVWAIAVVHRYISFIVSTSCAINAWFGIAGKYLNCKSNIKMLIN